MNLSQGVAASKRGECHYCNRTFDWNADVGRQKDCRAAAHPQWQWQPEYGINFVAECLACAESNDLYFVKPGSQERREGGPR